jgi:hypothetical protein
MQTNRTTVSVMRKIAVPTAYRIQPRSVGTRVLAPQRLQQSIEVRPDRVEG